MREFTDEPVPDALIGSLIETARYAPTAGNAQGVSWLVLRGRETVRRVAEIAAEWLRAERDRMPPSPMKARFAALSQEWENGDDVIFRGAPALVVAHADERQAVALFDCTLALGYLDLLAWAAGLGTCWGGFGYLATLGWPALREHLALPPQHKVMGMMMLGYPQYRYRRIPERDQATIAWRA